MRLNCWSRFVAMAGSTDMKNRTFSFRHSRNCRCRLREYDCLPWAHKPTGNTFESNLDLFIMYVPEKGQVDPESPGKTCPRAFWAALWRAHDESCLTPQFIHWLVLESWILHKTIKLILWSVIETSKLTIWWGSWFSETNWWIHYARWNCMILKTWVSGTAGVSNDGSASTQHSTSKT